MNYHALCFVDMPFGQKPDLKSGVVVDFVVFVTDKTTDRLFPEPRLQHQSSNLAAKSPNRSAGELARQECTN
jgi:hypothetical protein